MQSHEHAMSDAIKSHESTLELLFDATSGFEHADPIQCAHCHTSIYADSYGAWVHHGTDDESCDPNVPADFPVRPLFSPRDRGAATTLATCGACGLAWDDAIGTEWTPAPSARCPFEYFHTEAAPSADDVARIESAGVDVDDVNDSATSAIDSYALSIETETVLRVQLSVGGPTVEMSAIVSRDQYGSWGRDSRVTFYDSWAVPNETSLSDDSMLTTLFDRYVESYQPDND